MRNYFADYPENSRSAILRAAIARREQPRGVVHERWQRALVERLVAGLQAQCVQNIDARAVEPRREQRR